MEVSHNVRTCQALIELGFEYSRFSKRLDRTYAGFTLGDDISAFETSEKGTLLGTDEIGGKIYFFSTRHVSSELLETILYCWHDQLALIKLKYSRSYSGGWQPLVEQTTDQYGPPSRDDCRRVIWNDGQTVFILDDHLAACITTSLGDLAFVLKFLHLEKLSAPKLSMSSMRYRHN